MTCVRGRESSLRVSADNWTTSYTVDGVMDITLNGEMDELECTHHGSTTREFIPNLTSFTLDASMHFDENDPGQTVISQSYFGSTSISIRFDAPGGAGKVRYQAKGFATSFSVSGPLDDVMGLDVTFRLSELSAVTQ